MNDLIFLVGFEIKRKEEAESSRGILWNKLILLPHPLIVSSIRISWMRDALVAEVRVGGRGRGRSGSGTGSGSLRLKGN